MQNWNQWQLSTGTITTSMPQSPAGYVAPGTDPLVIMQSYMQYYNQPAPSGYTAEQWAAAQQQSWAQWQQWQQQYQQWQSQYGEKYQETMKQLSSQSMNLSGHAPPLPAMQPPPLPKEDTKPPLPPNTVNSYQFTNMPPPHQNNLPLFPAKQSASSTVSQSNDLNCPQNPPLPSTQPPLPPESGKIDESVTTGKRSSSTVSESGSAKKLKIEDEDLTEAEKTFDAQFKQWEEQFNKWKQQNVNHPDKTQYKQYEAKWTSWREKLIERREQMRKKREQQKQIATKSEIEKSKNLPGGDKIMNILSSTENQGLINNLLGIGKTLGLTGKQSATTALQPPPPPPQTTSDSVQSMSGTTHQTASQLSGSSMTSASWTAQQWAGQYNSGLNMQDYSNFQAMSGISAPIEATSNQMALPNFTLPPPNISNSGLNFSQPPPGFSNEGGQHLSNTNMRANLQDRSSFGSSGNNINTYGPNNRGSSEINRLGSNECSNQSNRSVNFEPIEIPMNARINDGISSKGQLNMGSEYLGRDRHIKNLTDRDGNQFRSNNAFGPHTERFKRGDEFYHLNDREGIEGGKYYNRENISYLEHGNSQCNSQNNFTISNNRFGPDRLGLGAGQGIDRYGSMPDRFNITSDRFGSGGDPFIPGNERFGPVGDRFGPTSDRFASSGERFTSSVDRFGSSGDRFGSGNIDRFGPNGDRFGNSERYGLGGDRSISGNDRFGSASDRLLPPRNDRFGPVTDRFGQSNDRCGLGNDRFGSGNDRFTPTLENIPCNDRFNRNNIDRFDIKDMADNRRDSHGNNRNFNRGNQFGPSDELAPELKKLMEKRRAAMDVFKPSFLDSDKSSNVGSLRESFKKIAGDSPFLPRNSADFGSKDFMSPKGLINPSSRGVGLTHFRIFGLDNRSRGPNDFKPHGGPEFKSHSLVNFNPCSNTFDLPDVNSSAFRESTDDSNKEDINRSKVPPTNIKEQNEDQIQIEGNLNSQKIKDFVYSEISDDVVTADVGENNLIEKASKVSEERNESESNVENIEVSQIKNTREEVLNNSGEAQSNTQQDSSVAGEDPLPLEKLPWMDVQFSEVSLPDKDPNNVEHNKNTPSNYITSTEQQNENSNEKKQILNSEEKKESNEFDNNLGKKTEALPFMGENDPKPEDLNMEPPPELPNLGPVSTPLNIENSFTCTQAINESFNTSDSRQHDSNAESYHSKTEFDNLRGSRGVQFRSHVPQSYNPRNSNDERCFALGSRDQNNFPFNNTNSSLARPPNSSDEQFVPLSSSDTRFGSRGSNDAQINFRVSNNRYAGSWRPTDTLSDNQMLVDTQFGSRGPLERPIGFSDSSDRTFNSRRPNEGTLESRGSSDGPFNLRGPNSGQFSHHNTQDRSITEKEFDVRNNKSNDRSFTLRVSASSESPFLPRGLNDQIVTHHTNERSLNNKPPFGNRGFVDTRFKGFDSNISSNANDGCNVGTPSVLAMKAENNKSENLKENYPKKKIEIESMDFGNEGRQQHLNPKQLCDSSKVALPYHVPFSRNSFGDIRSESRLNNTENILSDQDIFNKMKSEKKVTETNTSSTGDFKTGYEDRVTGSDYNKFGTPNIFTKRSVDTRQLQSRLSISKEFCIERQFNYNHGGAVKDKYNEHTPAKIIDYAHTSHLSVQDYMTPTQCFDYGHGSLKPTVPDHELLPQKDFRHWEENEHNLKEYIERMEKYESRMQKHEVKRFMGYSKTICDWKKNDKKSEIEKKDRDEYKERERVYEERSINHKSNKDQDNHGQSDRIRNKERSHDRREGITTDASKEYDNEDIRSKEHTTWQESSSKNIIETKSPHSSISDKQQNASEIPLKTLELAKIPNCTMVDDLLCPPGRQNRPPKIAIILRGPPGSGKSFVAKLIKDKEVEQGGSAPRILSLDDYFLVEKEIESVDDNGKKVTIKEMVYEYEEAMESSYLMSLVKAFKKNITDGFFNFIILDCINEKISDYEDMWSFAKTKGFKVYVCEMEMDVQICLKRNIHNRSEEEINRIVDYFEPTPSYHQKLDVNSMLQEQAIEEVQMEDSQEIQEKSVQLNEESQDSQEDITDNIGISKWERMEAENKLDRLDGLAKKKTESKPQTMEDFLQVPDYYNMEDTSGKKRVRWADLEERKQQEKMRAVGFVVGHTNWDRMMDPTKGGSALTRTKFFSLS